MRKLILLLAVFFAAFSIQTKAQTTVSIGSGTGTSNFIPIYYLYDYSYSQTIYTAAELTGGGAPAPGYINKIRYKSKAAVASTSNWKDWEIYIANTSKTSFTGVTDYISSSSMTMVFDGTLPASLTANDWIELTFSTPFLWDGSSNVVVAVRDKTLGWGTAPTWAGYTLAPPSGSKGIYFYQDNTTIDPTSPTALYTGATNTVAQIQLEMGSATPCSGMPTAGSATSSTTNACSGAPFSLGLSGQTQASGLTYQWQSATSSSGPWSDIVGATTLSYTTSQTTTTWYRCKVACGSDEAISDALEVTTPSLIGGTYTINDALPT
ncbi:MAG: hypothetical protein LC122_04875, partial [Chitinophagales bacterium]|nr:hypothetical protein [Chitinophagales bacterium]